MTYVHPDEGTAVAAHVEQARAENARRLRSELIEAGLLVPCSAADVELISGGATPFNPTSKAVLRLDARGRRAAGERIAEFLERQDRHLRRERAA